MARPEADQFEIKRIFGWIQIIPVGWDFLLIDHHETPSGEVLSSPVRTYVPSFVRFE